MAGTQSNVVRFPSRSTNPQPSPEIGLLKAAKAAYAAIKLVLPETENLIVRNLGQAIRDAEEPQPPKTPAPAQQIPRCEVSYSFGADLIGERAVMCGRPAEVECEHCGPICLSCLSETSCFGPEHKILGAEALRIVPERRATDPTQLLKDFRSLTCLCGNAKHSRHPFCSTCYHSLPLHLRAKMWLSPLDSDELLDRMVEARAYLKEIGMYEEGGVA